MVHTKFHQISPVVPEMKIFKGFTIYEQDIHLVHVTSIMLMNFHFIVPTSLHSKIALNLARSLLRKASFIVICKIPWAKVKK